MGAPSAAPAARYAFHAGGRKILDAIFKQLHFSEDNMRATRAVLCDYCNMSSPSVLFVRKELLDNRESVSGTLIYLFFAPDLLPMAFALLCCNTGMIAGRR